MHEWLTPEGDGLGGYRSKRRLELVKKTEQIFYNLQFNTLLNLDTPKVY